MAAMRKMTIKQTETGIRPPLGTKKDQLLKLMIFQKKNSIIQKLSTKDTQISLSFPQHHAQYIVVDIVQIGYILCLLVLKAA
jgi:hypothetical protein